VKTGPNMAESSKHGYGSKRDVLPMMMMMMRRRVNIRVKKEITQQVKTTPECTNQLLI
jgi:hypothetical protein